MSQNPVVSVASPQTQPDERRHDLDALRAAAMLLGIVLHAALSFAPIPWTVQDSQQSELYTVVFSFIHGFRMPLFFMLSGFFTAMLWRKRGLANLLKHRSKRILLPLCVGCFTIIPVMWIVSYIVSQPSPVQTESSALFAAVVAGDGEQVRKELRNSTTNIDTHDAASGSSPLCTAVFLGQTQIVEQLIDAGANVNQANRDQATPLHIAAFMGRPMSADLLLAAGAEVDAKDAGGATPLDLLQTDFGTTNFIASSLGQPLDQDELWSGRREIAESLGGAELVEQAAGQTLSFAALEGLLFQLPVFMHLWFLWFLCWLILAFVLYAPVANYLGIQKLPSWLVASTWSLLWLVPLTVIPQLSMNPGTFGPDPSIGLLPIPGVLAYYAIFFFFGAIYWELDDRQGQLGRSWCYALPFAILIVFPVALDFVTGMIGAVPRLENELVRGLISCALQSLFAWLMIIGLVGVFRQVGSSDRPWLRYLSDSAYWLYLAHLPLVLLAQWLVRDVPVPAFLKLIVISVTVTALLLVIYEVGVRYTVIGRVLNGPRVRRRRSQEARHEQPDELSSVGTTS